MHIPIINLSTTYTCVCRRENELLCQPTRFTLAEKMCEPKPLLISFEYNMSIVQNHAPHPLSSKTVIRARA